MRKTNQGEITPSIQRVNHTAVDRDCHFGLPKKCGNH